MAQPEVMYRKIQSARLLVLNRPSQLNSLNLNMINLMTPQLDVWQDSTLCKVIVLVGGDNNKNAFCAGGDVKVIAKQATSSDPLEREQAIEFFEKEYALNHYIGTIKKPFVSIMDGITMGGGVGLSVHCPFRICTENTVFAMPETKIGLFPDVGGSFFLPRLDGYLGTYFGLTGKILKGEDVFMAGIATHFVPSVRIPSLLNRLADLENDDLETVNAIIEEFVGDPLSVEQWKSWTLGGEIRKAIDRCFRFNTLEDIVNALEAEKTDWAVDTLNAIKQYSPTSLKLTLAQLRKGRNLDFVDCFRMEHLMIQEVLKNPDFFEGVSKHLIEKTGNPKWSISWEDKFKIKTDAYFTTPNMSPRPKLKLKNQLTYYEYPHRTLSGLPTEYDVKRVVEGRAQRGRKYAAPTSKQEVVDWLMAHWGGYDAGVISMNAKEITIDGGLGRGKVGLYEKVQAILDERVKEDGGLKWKE